MFISIPNRIRFNFRLKRSLTQPLVLMQIVVVRLAVMLAVKLVGALEEQPVVLLAVLLAVQLAVQLVVQLVAPLVVDPLAGGLLAVVLKVRGEKAEKRAMKVVSMVPEALQVSSLFIMTPKICLYLTNLSILIVLG